MEYIIISDLEDRLIKLGWSRGKRYADEVAKGWDPWWDFHVIIKKPGIDCDYISESMTESELLSLLALIQKSRDFESDREEKTEFMEPDYAVAATETASAEPTEVTEESNNSEQ